METSLRRLSMECWDPYGQHQRRPFACPDAINRFNSLNKRSIQSPMIVRDRPMTNSLIIEKKKNKNDTDPVYKLLDINVKGIENGFRCYFRSIKRDVLLSRGVEAKYLPANIQTYLQLIFTNHRVSLIAQRYDSLKIDDIIFSMNNTPLANTSPEYLTRYLANVKKDEIITFQILRSTNVLPTLSRSMLNHKETRSNLVNFLQNKEASKNFSYLFKYTVEVKKISSTSLGFTLQMIDKIWTINHINYGQIVVKGKGRLEIGHQIIAINNELLSHFDRYSMIIQLIMKLPNDSWIKVDVFRPNIFGKEHEKGWKHFMPFFRSSTRKEINRSSSKELENRLFGACPTPDFNAMNNFSLMEDKETNEETIVDVIIPKGKNGYGFRIIGGAEEGTQVMIGAVNIDGTAYRSGQLYPGDILLAIDGISVVGASHDTVVQLIESVSQRSQHPKLNLMIKGFRKKGFEKNFMMNPYDENMDDIESQHQNYLNNNNNNPYSESSEAQSTDSFNSQINGHREKTQLQEIVLTRRKDEGFGFVIVSSLNVDRKCEIGRILPNSPADRCGRLSVGDKILKINGEVLSDKDHLAIVDLIKRAEQILVLLIEKMITKINNSQTYFPKNTDDSFFFDSSKSPIHDSALTSSIYTQPLPYENNGDFNQLPYLCTSSIPPVVSSNNASNKRSINQLPFSPPLSPSMDHDLFSEQSSNKYSNKSLINVDIERGSKGFGFSVRGIVEENRKKIYIFKISNTGPIDKLRIGDEVRSINGIQIDGRSFEEVVQIMQTARSRLYLTLCRKSYQEQEEDL